MDPQTDGKRLQIQANEDHDPNLNASYLWGKIVRPYTCSDLTKIDDKLIALSGVAKMVKQMLEDRYLAGLWEGILPSQLLWQVFDSQQYDGRPSIRPPHYRAPSWIWASLDGFVDWPCITRTGSMITIIIETHVTPVTRDATGQEKDGFIRLRGHLCPAELYLNETKFPIELGLRVEPHQFFEEKTIIYPDISSNDISGIFYCLPIQQNNGVIESSGLKYSWVYGLILQSVAGTSILMCNSPVLDLTFRERPSGRVR